MLWQWVGPRHLGFVTGADGRFIILQDPQNVVVPYVAFVPRDRLPGGLPPDGYIPMPPDLAVEVISPSDEPGTIVKKRDLYRRAGIPLVWWADPRWRTVAVFRQGKFVAELTDNEELDGGEVLSDFQLRIAQVFAAL